MQLRLVSQSRQRSWLKINRSEPLSGRSVVLMLLENTHTYSLVTGTGDTDNSRFRLVSNTLKTAAIFDFETKSSDASASVQQTREG